MAVNLIDNEEIHVIQDGSDISLDIQDDALKDKEIVVGGIRTKNIFGNYTIINGWIYGTNLRVNVENGNRMAFIQCKPNTEYTISRSIITSTFRVSCYTTIPPMTSSNVDYTIPTAVENNNGTVIHFTTNSTATYLIVHYGTQEDAQLNQSLATIQVEEGLTATAFSPFQNLDSSIISGVGSVNTEYISNVEHNHWERSGNVVSYAFTMTVKGTWSSTTIFVSGLPRPKQFIRGMGVIASGSGSIFRFGIGTEGNLLNQYSVTTPSVGNVIEGQITYITID